MQKDIVAEAGPVGGLAHMSPSRSIVARQAAASVEGAVNAEQSIVEHLCVAANGVDLYVAAAGPATGPLVILLHGFPEFSYGWRNQIHPLAEAGFRVVAPDQRGYGYSSKPKKVAAYDLDTLAQDIIALADAFGRETFSLVGHDWGGIVAWRIASDYRERLERLVIINAPNLDAALPHLLKSPMQAVKSYYVALFQLPFVPELTLSALDFNVLAGALQSSSNPNTFSQDELTVYKKAWSQPGALTSMLNWYRALPGLPSRTPVRITTPTLVVWGDRDSALDASLAEDSAALCDDTMIRHVANATHWVHHEHPSHVNGLLLAFLGSKSSDARGS